jgi:hypothetical protein
MPDEQPKEVQATDQGADKQTDKGENSADTAKSDVTPVGEEDKGKTVIPPVIEDDNKEPEERTRMSKQDYIIGRQKAKLAKEQAKQAEADNDTEDDTIAPEDDALISKIIAKRLSPIIDKSLADEDNAEISGFLKDNPDFKEFETKARRYMQHPSRRQLPIKSIFYEVAGDKLIKIGAERERQAIEKAKSSSTGGGSSRGNEGSKSVNDMTPEEFREKQEAVRRGA